MKKQELISNLRDRQKEFNEVWIKIVTDINNFVESGQKINEPIDNITGLVDNLCLSGAWIEDRLNGITATTHNPEYKKSRTKKVRKALGYNI